MSCGACMLAVVAVACSDPEPAAHRARAARVDSSRVVPALRRTSWLQQSDADAARTRTVTVVRRPFVADLWWVYVDDGNHLVVSTMDLDDLGLATEQLHARAVANLAAHYPELDLRSIAVGVRSLQPEDALAAARLALTDQWRAEAVRYAGSFQLTVPGRSHVFVLTRPEDRASLEYITAQTANQDPYALGTTVLEWTDAGWRAAK